MEHNVKVSNYGDGQLKCVSRISGPSSNQNDFRALVELLQQITACPDLLRHRGNCPVKGRFFFENGCWVVESTTIIPK